MRVQISSGQGPAECELEMCIRDRLRDMEIIDRGNGEYECVPRGHSKATAIDLVLKHYGISLDLSLIHI